MRTALSADADARAGYLDLLACCARRGLAGVEVDLDDARASEPVLQELLQARRPAGPTRAAGDSPGAVGLLTRALDIRAAAARAARAGLPLVAGADAPELAGIVAAARDHAPAARVLPLMRGPAGMWLRGADPAGFAWQLDEHVVDAEGDVARILGEAPGLAYIRLVGGGPETALQEGRGIGAVMRRLALAGYDGPLVLTPSSRRYRIAWSTWLGRRGGWGCGSTGTAQQTVPATMELTP